MVLNHLGLLIFEVILENKIKYNCIFGGGGVRGICYIGALKALNELNIEIDSIAGSSVGAVFAGLLAAGYNAEEIKEHFFDFNFNMFRDININIFNTDISLSKGEIFLDWLRDKLNKKLNKDKVRFKDLKKDLYILTLDLNTNTPFIFSKETTPEEEVAFAIRTSACLPGLMKPISLGDALLVDGDLTKSWAGWKIYDELNTSNTRLLEFRLEGTKDNGVFKNPMDYLNSIISTIWYLCTENIYNSNNQNDRYDYVVIDAKDVILFDFAIEKDIKEKLVDKGYETTKKYFKNTLIKKKKDILPIYINIENNLKLLEKSISNNNPTEALFVINEILSSMHEDTKYIDISIYEKIKDLKNSLQKNIKKTFLTKRIDNEKQIKERTEFINMLVKERIDDLNNYIKIYSNKT
ncbi:MAG: hypothetical protein E7Z90_00090 [Cyanobacteria bacterium SIG29]|nr:hypothetical protein [Cyanobacteria bacterium SIG29]